jgi:hypothetical protein
MPAELLYLGAELLYLGAKLLYLGPEEVLNLGVVLENLLAGAGVGADGLGLKLLPGGLAKYDPRPLKGFCPCFYVNKAKVDVSAKKACC